MASVLDAHHFRMRLEKTRAAMSDLIESVPLGLIALDHTDAIQMINTTAEATFDIRRRDVVGADYRHALPQKMSELVSRTLQSDSGREEAELSLEKPGAETPQYVGVTTTPMRSEDGSSKSGHVIVCRDMQLSHEVEKLRELDAMKSDFLSLVTHELRTPLTSIMTYSETLMMDGSENVPDEWREYVNAIYSEGKRLSRLIDDVLDMTRMGAGKMAYTYAQQDPNELIGSVVMSLTPQFEEKGHELELDLADDMTECRLDTDRCTQVLLNIVSNAIRYTDNGGKITISSKKAEPLPGTSSPSLLVTVEDNGSGIAADKLDKVFSAFEIGESVKNHTSGTGLGMAICKQVIEDGHDGKIWLESEVGKGTKVFVQIPMA
jgi:two-component system phosphate regulon sensor histidine kinase PhoR